MEIHIEEAPSDYWAWCLFYGWYSIFIRIRSLSSSKKEIEKYFSVEQNYTGESDYEEFKDFVFSTNPSEMIFHVYKHGLFKQLL
ncbi:hypothetical protein ERICIV_04631 (plasmid) [Paenibacillus larvae subsp. larvae]|uniref:Uncharacterized protein n=1 Tax=Paenibacillus larvae subsp. larvae TaxID=147375 RepID=A0A2L1UKD7_9BACL|nr:hypothetical protein [Paenibacillus larvae]AQT87048.1 hypothetical protein B1222_23760 [Paenibacillus larvae subsp. pulvifaciens]AQZ49366.1 hypothetical protein B5S25_22960 [Paenibacillus larvae subsp. pulvifaciens]AVF29012.1 hypothetical protein ERICIII_05012 [Paenibacillus larvae subsp. larvae]AVF33393.1 hypothetical protein ERICIV_04631 [Paenibacillus larvae subsp. larvae]MBH0343896.1 hypothetical protein [Paenibacillus larvae]